VSLKKQKKYCKKYHNGSLLPISFIVLFLLIICKNSVAQQSLETSLADLEKEVVEWQDKIKDIKQKINKQEDEITREKNTFLEHQKRELSYQQKLSAQVDSLRKDIAALHTESDSLSRAIESSKISARNYDLRRNSFRKLLIGFCTELVELLGSLPPSNLTVQTSAVNFLKGELETHSVDESEALERIWQILNTLTSASQSVDVYLATSPVTEIKGQVFFIRMGLVATAVVKGKGEAGAVWVTSIDSTSGKWVIVEDDTQRAELWNVVQVREQRAIPQLVSVPFDHEIKIDTTKTGVSKE
jgi:cell division protein FtsB